MTEKPWHLPVISELDLVWLAGLLEGEGCFGTAKYQWDRKHDLPSIQINMTDRDVIERAARLMGGGQKVPLVIKPRNTRYKTQYKWRVNGRRAAHLMHLLLPHMGKRRSNRISAVLERYERTQPIPRIDLESGE